MQPSIDHEVRQFVIDNFLFGQGGTLTNDESFLESGIIDSTGVLELVGFLEQHFKIAIEDRELVPANLDSVSRVVQFVERKRQSREARLAG
jgi:acyl carrier protein